MNTVQNIRKILRIGLRTNIFSVRRMSAVDSKIITKADPETGIVTMLMNNPPLNIFTAKFLVECTDMISKLNAVPSVPGVILTSNFNGRVFTAGLNIFDMYQRSFEEIVEYWTLVQGLAIALYTFKKPIVAALNGHSPAAGCAFSMMCDYRIMVDDENKRIGMNESVIGLVPVPFLTNLMKSTIGSRKAELSLLQGKMFSPREACKINLVDEVVDLEKVHELSLQTLKPLIKIPVPTYEGIKLNSRKDNISEMAEYRKEDAKNFASQTLRPMVQAALGKYIQNIQQKKT